MRHPTIRMTNAAATLEALAERLEAFESWRDSRGRPLDTDTYDALISEMRIALSLAASAARS